MRIQKAINPGGGKTFPRSTVIPPMLMLLWDFISPLDAGAGNTLVGSGESDLENYLNVDPTSVDQMNGRQDKEELPQPYPAQQTLQVPLPSQPVNSTGTTTSASFEYGGTSETVRGSSLDLGP